MRGGAGGGERYDSNGEEWKEVVRERMKKG